MQALAKILGLVLVTLAIQLALPAAERGLGDNLISRGFPVADKTESIVSRAITVTSNTGSIVSRAITVTSNTGSIVSRAITVTSITGSIISRAITVTSITGSIISRAITVNNQLMDCNGNGVMDACDIDCGMVGGSCDVVGCGLSADCNANGIPDECEIDLFSTAPGGPFFCTLNCDPDCNGNGVPDECDISSGPSNDCNGNGIPDECDTDCNSNGIPDACDITSGSSGDCDGNGIPDECQVITDCNTDGIPDECQLSGNDCNANGIPDDCDILNVTSLDCNADGIPDECQLAGNDCNANGIPDDCDISNGTSQDCDADGIPDECQVAADCNGNGQPDTCDIAGSVSADCNTNGIPDECEIDENSTAPGGPFFCTSGCDADCNNNGVPDACDISSGTSQDCNGNGIPDECDIGAATSIDCNGNGIPDECEADCNDNGVPDECDITNGTSLDANLDGIPDECVAWDGGQATLIGPLGFPTVEGLAFDPVTGTLFGTDTSSDQLLTINPLTGAATAVGPLGFDNVSGLAFDPATNTLFGTDVITDRLITINTTTGVGTAIGSLGFIHVAGLAFDSVSGTLFGADEFTNQLITINPVTGAGIIVGAFGFTNVRGLAFDAATGTLFGTDTGSDQLITISTTTGVGTVVGPLGFGQVDGLAFDSSSANLFGSDILTDQLILIDLLTFVGDEFWSTPENWVENIVPGTDPMMVEQVVITGVGTNVILDIFVSIDSLTMGLGATLGVTSGDLTLDSSNGLRNDGSLTVADGFSIQASSPTSLRGSQPVQLAGPTAAISSVVSGDTITNFGTISGQGIIDADFVNDAAGSVIALSFGVLQIADPVMSKVNNGLFKATNDGTLRIDARVSGSGSYAADDGGTIEFRADIMGIPGAFVSFTVTGGTMIILPDPDPVTVDGCGPIIVRTGSPALFTVDGSSLINASSWTIGDAIVGPDRATMELLNGSTGLVNGPVTVKQNGTLRVIDSSLTATDLILEPGANLQVGSSLTLSGSFTNDKTDGTSSGAPCSSCVACSWCWEMGSTLRFTGGQGASMDPDSLSLTGWAGLEAASIDAGPTPPGNGFVLASIALSGGAHVSLTNFADNGAAGTDQAVYCDSLTLGTGAVLNLNGIKLYVDNAEVNMGQSGGGMIKDMSLLLPGDLNNDGQFDEGDMAGFIDVLTGQNTDPTSIAAADLNGDGVSDGLDVQAFVDEILAP